MADEHSRQIDPLTFPPSANREYPNPIADIRFAIADAEDGGHWLRAAQLRTGALPTRSPVGRL